MRSKKTKEKHQGLVQVYTGDGKGKTTAALGLGLLELFQVDFNPRLTNPSEMFQAVVRAGGDGRHNYSARLISG